MGTKKQDNSFMGSLEHAPKEILHSLLRKDAKPATYTKQHDLEMVVYCVFHRVCPSQYKSIHYVSEKADAKRAKWILAFRKQHLGGCRWQQLLQVAKTGSHRDLKDAISKMQLVGVNCPNDCIFPPI